ncbi:MAG: LD-carboxypeptidase [Myxococcales bacterium]|nr:LD-carboxypeptidase [Polyangiaceae bacterium]MDW8249020.1 LD-carboxypeptidase [Myxococcales bacterium]
MRFPPPLRPGDVVAVFAGSSPFDPTLAWRGLGWLASRYRLRFDRSIFERHGYLAGSDERRRQELSSYLADASVRALIAVRGGYGLSRIVHEIDWSLLREYPRWIVGFSDVTALHVEAARLGIASIHGPMVAALGRGDTWTRSHVLSILETPLAPFYLAGLRTVHPGVAEGPLAGGNLTMLHACAAAGRLSLPEGCILLLEDVTERPYRLDRMLTTLQAGGHLAKVSGVLLGDFTDCDPGPDGVTAEQVLGERLGVLGVPVLSGAPVGHGLRNLPMVLGRWILLDGGKGEAISEAGR